MCYANTFSALTKRLFKAFEIVSSVCFLNNLTNILITSSTPADVINRYVEALLQSQNDADPLLVSGVNEEIEQSKKLISKLRRRLAGKG